MLREYKPAIVLAGEIMETYADTVIPSSEMRSGLVDLANVLRESPESAVAFVELMQLARLAGRNERRVKETKVNRVVQVAVFAGFLVAMLAFGALFSRPSRGDEAAINRVYQRESPAVANVGVPSAGVAGSGVVFDGQGHILTSFHVIEQAQTDEELVVQLPAVGQVSAKLIGYDRVTDLAVLKVDVPPDRLTVASFGNADKVRIGDLAIAIGSPFGLSRSLTVGHISAVERRLATSSDGRVGEIEGVFQTDAAINPGNSGGPLFNASGQVIGINARIESPSGGSVGIGFAIPSNLAVQVAHAIIGEHDPRRSQIAVR